LLEFTSKEIFIEYFVWSAFATLNYKTFFLLNTTAFTIQVSAEPD